MSEKNVADAGGAAAAEAATKEERLERALKLELPIIAVLGEKQMTLQELLGLRKDSIIAFKKANNEPMELFVNDRRIGSGKAIKVKERFGIWIDDIGSPRETIEKLA
jgi:flagellar motor switch/type III secretory pathway protein FliN